MATTADPQQLATIEDLFGKLLREKSGFDIATLDRSATFLELGFDSLFLIQLSQEIKRRFAAKVTFRQLIEEVSTIELLIPHLASISNVAVAEPNDDVQQTEAATSTSNEVVSASPATVANVRAPVAERRESSGATTNNNSPEGSRLAATPVPMRMLVPGSGGDIEQIIMQQNLLMARHLDMLQGTTSSFPQNPCSGSRETSDAVLPTSQPQDTHTPPATTANNGRDPQPTQDSTSQPTPATSQSEKNFARFGPYKPIEKGANHGLTQRQRAHLDAFIARYTKRTAKSKAHAQTHRDHFADPRGVAGYRRIWKSMVYQITVEKSKGSKLWDIDGNEYVDIAMGFGLNLFGQSPDFVTEALHKQLECGVEVAPQSPIAGEVAQLLADFSRQDRVTFCNTGSEAVMAALRLSRTVTGKSKFVFFNKDYHGNFDQVLVRSNLIGNQRRMSPAAPGVPQSYADTAIVLDYGTQEALDVLRERADEIAAVLIEPVQSGDIFIQPREFLHEIRQITKDNDIAMIMDEVITGFRAAPGGAQEWFDVWGDMATYGKILGGGMPIGALAGSKKYMDGLDGGTWNFDDDSEPGADMTFFAGTFVRHPLALAAAHQVLMRVKEEGPELQERLTKKTTHLVSTLNRFFEKELIPIRVGQFTSQFRFVFPQDLDYADMLYFHLLERGVFTRGWGDNCFLSTEHSDDDIEHVIKAVKESCLELRAAGFLPDPTDAPRQETPAKSKSTTQAASFRVVTAAASTTNLSDDDMRFSCIDEIQPEGTQTPIFCMPAADGLTKVYIELSDELGDDQPLYGLNSPGVVGEPLPDTLEELAARFVEDIREVQPEGPYQIIGYCSGGTLALEVAQQIKAAGDDVSLCGLIETYNWLDAPSTNPTLWINATYEIQRIDFHIRNFLLLSMRDKLTFMRSKWERLILRTGAWRGAIASLFRRRQQPNQRATVNMAQLWRDHDDLSEAYIPQRYPGKLVHFRPASDYWCHRGTELEADVVEIKRMRAYPAGMMVEPFVAELAEELNREMKSGLVEHQAANASADDATDKPRYAVRG